VYYLIGRLSRGTPGGRMDAWAERITKGYVAVAEARVARLGPRAIIVCYPFYGVSAASQVVSGVWRMRLVPFYLALGVVSLPYAVLQAVIGLAALRAIVIGYGSWVLGIALVGGLMWWFWRRRHGAPPREPGPPDAA